MSETVSIEVKPGILMASVDLLINEDEYFFLSEFGEEVDGKTYVNMKRLLKAPPPENMYPHGTMIVCQLSAMDQLFAIPSENRLFALYLNGPMGPNMYHITFKITTDFIVPELEDQEV